MKKNKIIVELENKILKFNSRNFDTINNLNIIRDNDKQISIVANFEYTNYYENKKIYNIGINFINIRINPNLGLDLVNLMHINKLSIENISNSQLDKLNWQVIDVDDDEKTIFEFYCEEIKIEYIK
jgi:hypothetical protein